MNARASRGHSPHLDLFFGGLRGPVLVEVAGVGLGDVPFGEVLDDDDLLTAEGPGNHDFIAGLDLPVRLRRLAVDVDPADFAGFLGLGPGAEEARDVQPDVEPLSLHAIISVSPPAGSAVLRCAGVVIVPCPRGRTNTE